MSPRSPLNPGWAVSSSTCRRRSSRPRRVSARLSARLPDGGRIPGRFTTRLAAATVLARALGVPLPGRPISHRRIRLRSGPGADVTGRLWTGGWQLPAVVVAGGVSPQGPDDPRLVRLARALAGARRAVFVPRLALSDRRLDPGDVDRLVRAVAALDDHPGVVGGVSLLGFSFGGSFALLAAADPQVADRVRWVSTFGAYGHLIGLVQAATTGVVLIDGRPHPAAGRMLAPLELARALSEHGGEDLLGEHGGCLKRALAGDLSPAQLPTPVRALHAVLANQDPARTAELVAAVPGRLSQLVDQLSPTRAATQVRAPVSLLHAVDDPVVPFAELHRLSCAFPEATASAVRLFGHVDFRPSPAEMAQAIRDLAVVWRFAVGVLDGPAG